jgi:hypothetical protein
MDVYIEPVPRGFPEGTPIMGYAVETRSGKVLQTLETRQEAIDWAKGVGCGVYVPRVRNTSKGNSEHWIEI